MKDFKKSPMSPEQMQEGWTTLSSMLDDMEPSMFISSMFTNLDVSADVDYPEGYEEPGLGAFNLDDSFFTEMAKRYFNSSSLNIVRRHSYHCH